MQVRLLSWAHEKTLNNVQSFLFATAKPPDTSLHIDIHGLHVEDVLYFVRALIANAPNPVEKVVVVHGYNNGRKNELRIIICD